MSHFLLVALMREDETPDDIEARMETYNACLDVEDYDEACFCVNAWGVAEKDCGECEGKGVYHISYNPDAKWDWYRMGGRWDGIVAGLEITSTDNGFNFSAKHESFKNNNTPVSDLIERIKTDKFNSFAYLLPGGEWVEKGDMGWFGTVTSEKDEVTWKQDQINILDRYKDGYIAVGYDCHI